MNLSKILVLFAATLCVSILVSCQTFHDVMRVEPKDISDFLPEQENLVKQNSKFPYHYLYVARDAPAYDKIYIAPVNLDYLEKSEAIQDFIENSDGQFEADLQELAEYTRQTFHDKYAEKGKPYDVKVVDNAGEKDCFTLELAIVAITPAKGGWNIAGVAADCIIGLGSIFTSQFAYGALTMEGKLIDNNTGRIIAMFATTEADENTLLVNVANFTWLSGAKTNVWLIAEYGAELLYADNYEDVERNFPIQWLSY